MEDTVVVPSHPRGFEEVFLGEMTWEVRLHPSRVQHLHYIAVYQTKPISAITHYDEIVDFVASEKKGKFLLKLKGSPKEFGPVRLAPSDVCAPQGPRFTLLSNLVVAKNLTEAFRLLAST